MKKGVGSVVGSGSRSIIQRYGKCHGESPTLVDALERGAEAHKWSRGESVDQCWHIRITLMRSLIRIRIKVKS
jgi:hypothetical protein